MKSIVLYYSLDGNTELIANAISDEIGADIEVIRPNKDLVDRNSFMKYSGDERWLGGKRFQR